MSINKFISFEKAFLNISVGKRKIKESEYKPFGKFKIIDQGKRDISGYSDNEDLVLNDPPYILFGDHTRVVKYIDCPFIAGADGIRLFKANEAFEPLFLYFYLRSISIKSDSYGRHSKYLQDLSIPILKRTEQIELCNKVISQFDEVEKAKKAIHFQTQDLNNLENAIIYESINNSQTTSMPLSGVLIEVKKGIGELWQKYPVYGATRNGLALAKEPPGKFPQRYKPVIPGTVFYNPMRILIGSIAFAEDDQADGITSPDYVVLKGKESVVDSRWFYYWLRSPMGKQCINSLARGAVRERMLFNRLAEGKIDLPDYEVQLKASAALASIKSMKANVKLQMEEINTIPERLLLKAFEKNINV